MTPMDADDDGQRPTTAVVLAAGAGTRMRSRLPKVLHPLAGRPMLLHVLHAVRAAGIPRAVVVTGIDEEQVRAGVSSDDVEGLDITFAHQAEPRGTGNALLQAREVVTGERVVVVNGDLGLLTGAHLRALVAATPCRAAVATITVADPAGLGRVVRDGAGRLTAIVEEVETSAETARIDEVCAGLYRFETAWLWPALAALPAGASGEIYLTDAIARAAVEPGGALAVPIDAADGPLNVEDRQDLARAERVLRARLRTAWMRGGVTIVDPATTYIDADVHIEPDTVLEPGTHLRGRTVVGGGSRLGPNAVLRDAVVGANCVLEQWQRHGRHPGGRRHGGALQHAPRRHRPGRRRPHRHACRDEKRPLARGRDDGPFLLSRRRGGGRGDQHRRGGDHLQLRRRGQAPHPDRRARFHWQ